MSSTAYGAARGPGAELLVDGSRRVGTRHVVLLLAALAALARVAQVGTPLSADEAGFLTVAAQWRPGDSLYGSLWVDRPPGLVLVYGAADALGGQVALRLLGAVVAAGSVLAAALLARVVTRRTTPVVATAVLVAALVSSKFLQVDEVNGELLALPWLLLGLAALAVAYTRATQGDRSPVLPALAAGAAGALAASVKQNLVDVLLAVVVVSVGLLLRRRARAARQVLGSAVLGAALVTVVLLAVAWTRGTTPLELWDALVVFRVRAGEVISSSASPATAQRAGVLVLAWLASGLPLALVGLARLRWRPTSRRPRPGLAGDPVWSGVTVAVLGFETVGVALGGSYWWHYLVGLVPGTALLVAMTWPREGRLAAPARALLGGVVVSTMVGLAWLALLPPQLEESKQEAVDHVLAHREPGDTGVVAYGQPQLLRAAGLTPAYEHLWSLPVRVRDPRLTELGAVLAGPDRPDWLLVGGRGLQSWGIDPASATRVARAAMEHYEVVERTETLTVLRRTD